MPDRVEVAAGGVDETTKCGLKRDSIHLNKLIFAKPNNYEGRIQKI
jgi:hypothetical protein